METVQNERVEGWKRVDDGDDCGTRTFRMWLKFFNGLVCVVCLGLISVSIYLSTESVNTFAAVIGGIGLYALFTGVMGIYVIGKYRPCLLYVYTICFLLLFLFQLTLVIGCLFFMEDTISVLQKIDGRGRYDIDQFRDSLEAGHWFTIVVCVAAGLQLLTLISICFCRRHIMSDEEWRSAVVHTEESVAHSQSLRDNNNNPRSSFSNSAVSRPLLPTPHADSQRDRMNDKYGGLFNKQRNYNQVHAVDVY